VRKEKKKITRKREEGKGFWPATLQLQKANIFPFRSGLLRFFFIQYWLKAILRLGMRLLFPMFFLYIFLLL
jgi:hypothetical protein